MGIVPLQLANHVGATDEIFDKLIKATNICDRKKESWYTKFNRFGCIDPYNTVTSTREYIFFTKPDLHMFESTNSTSVLNKELSSFPLFTDALERYNEVLQQLQYSVNNSKNVFVNLLSNTVKSSLDVPDINAGDTQTGENIFGTFMTYRKSSLTADEQHEFSLEFEDTKYLEVYMWFRLFDEYCKFKDFGLVTPPSHDYIINKILHDQMAVYKLIVGEDGETLLYWAKLWGVYPKAVPRAAFSDLTSLSGGLRFTVNFKSQFVDDMDPTILSDLNLLTLDNYQVPPKEQILPLYDTDIHQVSGEWAGVPFVVRDTKGNSKTSIYKLKWRRA